MRLISTLCFVFFFAVMPQAQSLKGVWRGTFEQNNLNPLSGRFSNDSYKYEVQINQLPTGALEGVTYSYLTTVFYGKASLKGIFDKKNKTLTIKETILIDVKASGKTDPCLMTCYLDYKKNGKLETLIGTYSSINMKTKADCGNGIVYLEKVEESDFVKEDFLKTGLKKNNINTPRKLPSGKNFEADRIEEQNKLNTVKNNTKPTLKNIVTTKPKPVAKPATNVAINKNPSSKSLHHTTATKLKTKKVPATLVQKPNTPEFADSSTAITTKKEAVKEVSKTKIIPEPVEDVLKERENKLVNIVYVDTKDATIEFYDNGEIDNDSISVYKDNKLVINNERLSTRPIILNLKFDDANTYFELITVAENLGYIPPNTALMVINYGRKREEVFLTSDEKRNAKVIIKYKAR